MTSPPETLSLDDATDRVAAFFARCGASGANARSAARALVAAEADGLAGHGLSRVPTYAGMLRSGKIDGRATPTATRPRPGLLAVDAAHGFAYPAIDLAIEQLPAIARGQGLAAAAIRRSGHCGAAGLHVEALANLGLVALLFANTPEAIAPWGGRRAVFGTNPIAFAAPLAGRAPIVVDLALSKVARGRIVAAGQRAEPIPEGWALDREGRPTTDPAEALAGTMVAMGDAKGAALALMVEVMAACLVGASLSLEASSFLREDGPPPGTGQLLLALDPAGFGHEGFGERMTRMAEAIEGQDGARLPGARRLAMRARAEAAGLAIPPDLATMLAGQA